MGTKRKSRCALHEGAFGHERTFGVSISNADHPVTRSYLVAFSKRHPTFALVVGYIAHDLNTCRFIHDLAFWEPSVNFLFR